MSSVTPCVLCGGMEHRAVVTTRAFVHPPPQREWFAISQCRRCGLLFTDPPVPAERIGAYYEGYSIHRAPVVVAAPPPLWKRVARRFLDSRSAMLPALPRGARVLEVGAASGAFMATLAPRGWVVSGVEPSPVAAGHARSAGLDVRTGTLESAAFDTHTFDLVYAWHVFEHVADPWILLREIRRVAKPGAHLALSMPNAGGVERRIFGRYWAAWEPPIHYFHYAPETITALLRRAGFQQVRVYHSRNLLNVFQSIGAWLEERTPWRRVARYLLSFGERSSQLPIIRATYPLALVLAALGWGGRMMVTARAPVSDPASSVR